MNETNDSLKSKLDVFVETTNKFIKFGANVLSSNIEHPEDDLYGFMAVAFCWRQIEHLKSLVALCNSRCYQDMLIISRSMLEGFAFLSWAYTDKKKIGLKWSFYSWVHDYRLIINKLSKGDKVDNEIRKKIECALNKYGKLFLIKNKKLIIDFKEDVFSKFWHLDDNQKKINNFKLFEITKIPDLYECYEEMSDWIHWNISGFGRIIKNEDNIFDFQYRDSKNAEYSLSIGVLASHHSFSLLNEHFKLGKENEITQLRDEYLNELIFSNGRQ